MKKQSASELIKLHKTHLISMWEEEVRAQIKVAENTYQASLVNTLPVFLDNLGDSLDIYQSKTLATEGSTIAMDHGGERARLTAYTPEHIVKEYQILRITVRKFLKENDALTPEIDELVTLSIESACICSCKGFFETFMSLREHFMLTLSHDLRSPLTMSTVAAEYILKDPGNKDKVITLANKISYSLDRIDKMIQSLLDASRLKMGEKLSFHMKDADLISILHEVIGEFSLTHPDRFVVDVPKSIKGIWDPDALKRVFENLFSNAIKYGSPTKPITIKIEESFEKAIIFVHNEDSFISKEDEKKLFALFKRLNGEKVQIHKGWGIGLLLVKGVIEGHGGAVSIDSHPDDGTTFIVDLPIDAEKTLKSIE